MFLPSARTIEELAKGFPSFTFGIRTGRLLSVAEVANVVKSVARGKYAVGIDADQGQQYVLLSQKQIPWWVPPLFGWWRYLGYFSGIEMTFEPRQSYGQSYVQVDVKGLFRATAFSYESETFERGSPGKTELDKIMAALAGRQ